MRPNEITLLLALLGLVAALALAPGLPHGWSYSIQGILSLRRLQDTSPCPRAALRGNESLVIRSEARLLVARAEVGNLVARIERKVELFKAAMPPEEVGQRPSISYSK